jgi:hypothetical protein
MIYMDAFVKKSLYTGAHSPNQQIIAVNHFRFIVLWQSLDNTYILFMFWKNNLVMAYNG